MLTWIRYFARSASIANIIAASVLLIVMIASPPAWAEGSLFDNHKWQTGMAIGADPNGDYTAVTITRNWFPTHRELSWGVRTYVELGRYDYDGDSGNAVTVAVEPVVTWKGCYTGIGPSLGNTTPNLGTVWNFSITGGCDFEVGNGVRIGAFANHRSHASRLGIDEDKENGGVTTINLQLVIPLENLFGF